MYRRIDPRIEYSLNPSDKSESWIAYACMNQFAFQYSWYEFVILDDEKLSPLYLIHCKVIVVCTDFMVLIKIIFFINVNEITNP
ncbi:hypothetical protein AT251_19990 [Enterovibrio nigricans]|uniref:Uncharacterized protein n=1 Tax=Enterovibrio nigricans DSM 22720 TaxID=1121868 RepID=A0A1T4UP71_9GAMM|nr:hypothetical protein AT251_19990 [Enterovibrio nigricans]SKA54507.1 hypothetical protein SAMN02745132_02147 [Enterovibrio nigricans DSM 22720]